MKNLGGKSTNKRRPGTKVPQGVSGRSLNSCSKEQKAKHKKFPFRDFSPVCARHFFVF